MTNEFTNVEMKVLTNRSYTGESNKSECYETWKQEWLYLEMEVAKSVNQGPSGAYLVTTTSPTQGQVEHLHWG